MAVPDELLPTILSLLPDGLFVVGEDERVLHASARMEEILSSPSGGLTGLSLPELAWGPDGVSLLRAHLERARGGEAVHARFPARSASGERVELEAWARAHGATVVWIARPAVAVDEQATSSRTASGFRAMIEQLPDAIGVHRGGMFVYANTAAAKLFGADSPEVLVGTPILDVVHPDDRPAVAARLIALGTGAANVPFQEERLLRRDGTVATALVGSVKVDFEGQPAIVAIARDLAEQRRVQAQLALADRMASVGVLAAGIAHEINNPLTYVMLRLDALTQLGRRFRSRLTELRGRLTHRLGERDTHELLQASTPLVEDLDVHVKGASEGADRVRRIVADLRVFARADDEVPQATDVKRALDVAVGMAMHELRHRARLVRDDGQVGPVLASEGKLVQVFLNLLVNAGQAIGTDDPEKNEVRIQLTERNRRVCVTISDTGCGIAPEHQAQLFEPFFTTKPVGSGTGLGLAVCRGIVDSLGGTIRADSELGRGSSFTVELPVVEPSALSSHRPGVPSVVGEPALRILIVDDEAPIGRALRAALADLGEVVVVSSGAEAREEIERDDSFDLVLSDVRMPGMSGLQLHRWIVATRPALGRRVLLMTGGRLRPEELAVAEMSARRWLEKPFDLRELRARIDQILTGEDGDDEPPEAA